MKNYQVERAKGAAVNLNRFAEAHWNPYIYGAGSPMSFADAKKELRDALLAAIDCYDSVPEECFRDAIERLDATTVADVPAYIAIDGAELAYRIVPEED